ncbi:C4-dicarboxylate TRAP transporter substrate-binding protein [Szabonella alba]|uniref:C4-dicarboxylate TRAP transporter substrate-binding protein n=1 Tax=Szabonella alba TaxID=2804194 RepID=A0A8K0VG28_9RHOB|nr:C4-dicarboxylate TRAP transporter substrate-binding protein [Szabonella alba]MBL4919130.1 C4-dicarboxylate TRAP transporter substrate-binding protein [Szabonella alba]
MTRLIGALLGATFLAGTAAAQDYPALNLRFATYVSSDLPQSQVDQWWAEEIERRSGGQIKIEFFWSQSLGKSTEILQLVGSGAIDFGATSIGYYTSNYPLANISQLPMVLPDNRVAQVVADKLAELPPVAAESDAAGVVPLLWHSLPTYHLMCNKPIATVADFKGAKLRSFGEYVPMMWDALGATGVTVLAPEMYEGLQRGNVDCIYISADFAYGSRLHEVARYFNSVNFGAISAWTTFVSAQTWNSWPEEVRDLILEVTEEASARERDAVYQAAADAKAAMLAAGMTEVTFTEIELLAETVPDFIAVWKAQMETRGLGAEAAEVAETVRQTIATAQ